MERSRITKLTCLIKNPKDFFESAREEGPKPSFYFFLEISIVLSIVTPVVNYLGIDSTDFSSAYQAQILAYRMMRDMLLERFGIYAYLIQPMLILFFASVLMILGVGFLHIAYKIMRGNGSPLNAWKAMCYGVGPCVLGGFLPYVSLFAGFYSMVLQFYFAPKILYRVCESRAIIFLALILTLTFMKMFLLGTTTGLFE